MTRHMPDAERQHQAAQADAAAYARWAQADPAAAARYEAEFRAANTAACADPQSGQPVPWPATQVSWPAQPWLQPAPAPQPEPEAQAG
jgi:plasmid stabilization system protein ParE